MWISFLCLHIHRGGEFVLLKYITYVKSQHNMILGLYSSIFYHGTQRNIGYITQIGIHFTMKIKVATTCVKIQQKFVTCVSISEFLGIMYSITRETCILHWHGLYFYLFTLAKLLFMHLHTSSSLDFCIHQPIKCLFFKCNKSWAVISNYTMSNVWYQIVWTKINVDVFEFKLIR
jgi:hypothetical protein